MLLLHSRMHYIKPLLSTTALLVIIYALNTRFGDIPAMGVFLDPDSGFWANAETTLPASEKLEIDGLRDEVRIHFDERRVPHIFAQNDHDLYLAQGYVTAQNRLFQMEVQTYDAAGRLSENLGARTLSRDLTTRRWGMPYGAEKTLASMEANPQTRQILEAYSKGVNAYIESLDEGSYPLEYKILGFAPESWSPLKSALLLKNMTRTLASGNRDDATSNTIAYFGQEYVDRFFTRKPKLNDPIIPASRTYSFDAEELEAPDELFIPKSAKDIEPYDKDQGIGSNNWAISGDKTASGYPILANDPHLSLTMPSIWMEMQLHAPGLNVYGVALQGAPGIIIGFNEHIAWGVTNVGTDVADWYEIKFKDESKDEYWHDGQWKPTTKRIEEIKVRGQETVIDTLVFTHHGPVTHVNANDTTGAESIYHAFRWIAHEGSDELKTFYELNRARNYDDYELALTHYDAPAQNFVFASSEGDIALWVNGKLPKKWKHQGRTISDGTDPRYDWQGWIPRDQNPWIKNPDRGFVSSANQESAAENYPYYMDDDFASYERGRRINELLKEMTKATPDDIRSMQMDDYSYHAATALPIMLRGMQGAQLDATESEALQLLGTWDHHADAEGIAYSIFRRWWANFYGAVFFDEYRRANVNLRYPSRDIVVEVLGEDPSLEFIDDIDTEEVETLADIAQSSFSTTIRGMLQDYGPMGDTWKWGYVTNNDLDHIAFIPGLDTPDVFTGGTAEAINATRGGTGPSWRMVVELGPEVKGWGVYPGGISGNPGSPNYDAFVENWRKGQLFELQFMKQEPEDPTYTITINKRGQ